MADTNRDGTVDKVSDDGASSQDTKKRVFNRTFGATCLVNSDNDANESPPSGQHHNKDHDDDVVPIVPPNDEVELAEILVFKPDLTPDIPVSESVRVYIGIEPVPDVQFEQWLSNNGAVEVASRIRIFRKEDNGTYTRLLGKAGDGTTAGTAIYQITDSEDIAAINTDGLTLYVEGCDYASDCMICVSVYLLNELCKKDSVRMMPAPFLIVPQNRPLEMITAPRIQPYIVPSNTNLNSHAPMHSRIQDKVQNNTLEELYKFTGGASSVYRDVFPRDEWRLGTQSFPLGLQTTDPGCRGSMRVGLDLPRGRAAEQFGTDELTGRTVVDGTQDGPDEPRDHGGWSEFNLEGAESPQDAGDYGGNIEVTPPTTAFPLGLVTVGDSLADERIKKFLTRQRAQLEKTNGSYQYLALDAKWLKTGHVDELFNFLPGSAAPFKAVVPSPAAARQVLNDIAGDDDEVVWGNYATFFYGNWAEREEAGMVTSATSTSLTDDNKSFHSNFGQGNGYVRIWAGKGKGQVAEVASISNNGKTLNVGVVFRIPNAVPDPDTGQDLTYSEAIRRYRAGDVKANYAINFTNKSTPPGWLEEPDSTSRYVVVESSQNWGPPYDIPAIVTAQELRQDADLWNKNVDWTGSATARVQGVRDDLQNKLGAGNVQFVEVPALFMTQAAGNQALANRDVQVRLTAFGHTPDAKYRAWNHAARAMLPHMTNLMNISSQTSWVAPGPDAEGIVLSRPFGPRRPGTLGAQDGTDVIMEAAMTALGAGNVAGPVSGLVDADFVDIWNTRHLSDGHAHCGTNARRVPDTEMRQWWSQWPL